MKRYRNGELWNFESQMPAADDDNAGVVLGVDGGTTSTVCVCLPAATPSAGPLPDPLPILSRAVAGCSNHNSVGETEARKTLKEVIIEALSKACSSRAAVQAVCLAISGVNHPSDQQRILDWLRDIFPSHVKLHVENDSVAALASGTMGKLHGCVLIAGTGTIAYGFAEDGREARAAGAGPVLGDWGSGYGIAAQALTAVIRAHDGRGPPTKLTENILNILGLSSPDELIGGYGIAAQALTAVIRAHDGRGPPTKLTENILNILGLSSPDELIGWTYADRSWARIAALVPVVVSSAEDGDEVANKILYDSVQELADSVIAVVRRLRLCGEGVVNYENPENFYSFWFLTSIGILIGALVADGKDPFPLVMVGGVLEANKSWDIGKEVINCVSKVCLGAHPIRPKVEPAVGAALLAWNHFMKEFKGDHGS
ncbi:N-acetyl-D-glucosamine kinase [Cocos nucifera]|uniref:N-acetyl-D-glucosamine kinase n=1 Tax=Cocos nucifera TaxID=13894 RepID=A0A8K0I0W2_COCNU|nr:N-acetyl-D-glucosamine kinase [Cocos nucifera]